MPTLHAANLNGRIASLPSIRVVTKSYKQEHKASFEILCKLCLKYQLYSLTGQFQDLWTKASILDTTYIAYASVSRKLVGVAFIERGYDFGFIMPSECEGFVSCFVKPEYRNQGIAKTLCASVIEAGAFTYVCGQLPLLRSVKPIPGLKFHICR